ncbi:MAG: hypothetical protein JF597_01295 [Streptomyces sp.]|uniref:hypothetical protein n=1 Tax=Streptomyces sp. TaxID=1931 RepID=UPI0025F49691|nr:hypothetical protein [Streptomyces sp.]MBW8792269.1 hypothetical protein [Streptomyces sp.]
MAKPDKAAAKRDYYGRKSKAAEYRQNGNPDAAAHYDREAQAIFDDYRRRGGK